MWGLSWRPTMGLFSKDLVVLFQAAWGQKIWSAYMLHTLESKRSLRRARESVYWPGMNAAIKDFIEKCDICGSWRTYQQRREPLYQHDRPLNPNLGKSGHWFILTGGPPQQVFNNRWLLVELLWTRRAKENWCHSSYAMPSKAVRNTWETGWSDLWQCSPPPFTMVTGESHLTRLFTLKPKVIQSLNARMAQAKTALGHLRN